MGKRIKLFKNNDERDWTDLEWIEEFYLFLQGENPESITTTNKRELTPDQAMTVIWYLQEHFPVFPCQVEKCSICDNLYDTWSEGIYIEREAKFYCGGCEYLANPIEGVDL